MEMSREIQEYSPTLLKDYASFNSGWLMSEKLDGVRAIWNGKDYVSREGLVFAVPDSMKTGMPSVPLDGEFWCGRGGFEKTVAAVRSTSKSVALWGDVRFMVFDAPVPGTYDERMAVVASEELPAHVSVVEQRPVLAESVFDRFYEKIIRQGGEGAVLRDPDAIYVAGRSGTVLRRKDHSAEEVKVVGYARPDDIASTKIQSLICEREGKIFRVYSGMTDMDRRNPPAVGDMVTIRYKTLTNKGTPREPVFVSVRDYEGVGMIRRTERVAPNALVHFTRTCIVAELGGAIG
jgi:DNA ligase 1